MAPQCLLEQKSIFLPNLPRPCNVQLQCLWLTQPSPVPRALLFQVLFLASLLEPVPG